MPRRTQKTSRSAKLAAEMMLLSPWVAASRMSSMARRKSPAAVGHDLGLLAQEKTVALTRSGFAWATAVSKAQMDLAASAGSWFYTLARKNSSGLLNAYRRLPENVISAGLAPLHRKVVSNAKRLGKRRCEACLRTQFSSSLRDRWAAKRMLRREMNHFIRMTPNAAGQILVSLRRVAVLSVLSVCCGGRL